MFPCRLICLSVKIVLVQKVFAGNPNSKSQRNLGIKEILQKRD